MELDLVAQRAVRDAIAHAYWVTTYSNYVAIAGFALVVADYAHTFSEEVRYMWPARLSIAKVLFLILRYYVFVNNVFVSLYVSLRDASPEVCLNHFHRIAGSSTVLVLGAESILFLRTYAFSGQSKKLLAYLTVQFLVVNGAAFPVTVHYMTSFEYSTPPAPNMSCMLIVAQQKILGGVLMILLGGVASTLLSMVIMGLRKHHIGLAAGSLKRNSLLSVFYRDGLLYFVSISAILITSIAVIFAAPVQYGPHIFEFGVDIYAIISTRMLLHLRQRAVQDGVQDFRSGNAVSCTVDGVDYSAAPRSLTPIRFEEREVTEFVDMSTSLSRV